MIHRRLFLALVAILTLTGSPAMAVEEPSFTVSVREPGFEVRDYPPLIAAQVEARGGQEEAVNAGFRLLAAYIFGGNTARRSIAMTAPVVQTAGRGQSIAMTAPVVQTAYGDRWTVRFIMPRAWTMETLPTPNDARVSLVPLPPSRMAVVRFSGLARPAEVARRTASLQAFIAAHGLRATGAPELARYDPPWTPWFMRRNEVMIPVEAA